MDHFDDDDYVASLLKNEAKPSLNTHIVRGLKGLLPSRSTGATSKPKPNKRFLRNIVRDADSHNAALLARENAEAQARLRRLQREKDGRLSRSPSSREKIKHRTRHESKSPENTRREHHRHRGSKRSRSRSPSRHKSTRSENYDSDRRRRKPRSSRSRSPERTENRSHRRHGDRDRRRRSRSRSRDRRNKRRRRELEDRSKRRRSKSRVKNEETSEAEKRGRRRKPADSLKTRDRRSNSRESTFSDPLEELIGPSPPLQPRRRGRGATGQAAMDSRFHADYDPAMDAELDYGGEGGDFEDAVEAYRDRQRWNQQGAERLRSAGLGEDFIKAWESKDTKNEANLKWAKKGSLREWDRGKVLEDDDSGGGGIDLRADWIKK
ncbi:hypothetical protein FN846DRAFT_115723 [Sphaerosporella brunnea]|uniref:Pre-mRNA-splicing factor 38B n=1 Tax=Sphaerosporella brunnea TaxID=1250544 RepID=A0A5J5ERG9_9PEZI|nr:hypothetical protein FN846DRAFT_115723 [Sphaerosporella brunnea]